MNLITKLIIVSGCIFVFCGLLIVFVDFFFKCFSRYYGLKKEKLICYIGFVLILIILLVVSHSLIPVVLFILFSIFQFWKHKINQTD